MLSELWSTLLADLQALYAAQQSAHWRSSGGSFYGDHQLFQRLYEDTQHEIDQVAERLLGITGDDAILDPARMTTATCAAVKLFAAGGDIASSLLIAEKSFLKQLCGIIEALETIGQLTPGSENLLQGIADKHEEHVYLLSRRVGAEVLTVCVREAIASAPTMSSDIIDLRHRLNEHGKKKKRRKGPKTWDIGGPISTGPGNPGFNSSAGPGAS